MTEFLCFWELRAQKLYVEHWWNWHLISICTWHYYNQISALAKPVAFLNLTAHNFGLKSLVAHLRVRTDPNDENIVMFNILYRVFEDLEAQLKKFHAILVCRKICFGLNTSQFWLSPLNIWKKWHFKSGQICQKKLISSFFWAKSYKTFSGLFSYLGAWLSQVKRVRHLYKRVKVLQDWAQNPWHGLWYRVSQSQAQHNILTYQFQIRFKPFWYVSSNASLKAFPDMSDWCTATETKYQLFVIPLDNSIVVATLILLLLLSRWDLWGKFNKKVTFSSPFSLSFFHNTFSFFII